MSRMGKARKKFNKNLAVPPYLFDKPQFSSPGQVRAFPRRERNKNGRRIRRCCEFASNRSCLSVSLRGRGEPLPYGFMELTALPS